MSSKVKEKAADMGHAVADTAKNVGRKIAAGVEKAAEFVEDKAGMGAHASSMGIREHMDVVACCGTKVGVVDHVQGAAIKLTKHDSKDGEHHFVPTAWVDHVDNKVHLRQDHKQIEQNWKSDAASCGCGA